MREVPGSNPGRAQLFFIEYKICKTSFDTDMCSGDRWFRGVVVITSALHAEGHEFEPRQNLVLMLQTLADQQTARL